MKKLIYTSALFLFSLSWTFADHGARHVEGYWHSTCGSNSIEIYAKSYGLKIDGLSRDRKFRVNRRNVFKNRSGIRVEIISPRVILVTRRRGNHFRRRTVTTKYVRAIRGDGRDRYYDYDAEWYDERDDYRYRRYEGNDYRSYDDGYGGYENDRGFYARKLREEVAGNWQTRGLEFNKRIKIVSSSEGIKAKFKTSDRWFFYAQDRDRANVFTDNRGNQYILENESTLLWIGRDGKRYSLKRS